MISILFTFSAEKNCSNELLKISSSESFNQALAQALLDWLNSNNPKDTRDYIFSHV
jgi:hypothetical protein